MGRGTYIGCGDRRQVVIVVGARHWPVTWQPRPVCEGEGGYGCGTCLGCGRQRSTMGHHRRWWQRWGSDGGGRERSDMSQLPQVSGFGMTRAAGPKVGISSNSIFP
jgi:hypothetical protein